MTTYQKLGTAIKMEGKHTFWLCHTDAMSFFSGAQAMIYCEQE